MPRLSRISSKRIYDPPANDDGSRARTQPGPRRVGHNPWIEDRLRSDGTGYVRRTRSVPAELIIGSLAQSEGYDAAEFVVRINTWLAERRPDAHQRSVPRVGTPQSVESERSPPIRELA